MQTAHVKIFFIEFLLPQTVLNCYKCFLSVWDLHL